MTASKSMDPPQFLREQAASADPDVLRAMVKTFADALMVAGVGHQGRNRGAGHSQAAAGQLLPGQ
jgi:hypothetical protein